jgi:hypothetical protein
MSNEKPNANNETPIANISLRDYFAAQAMNALVSHNGANVRGKPRTDIDGATRSYLIADAMLRAREVHYENGEQHGKI